MAPPGHHRRIMRIPALLITLACIVSAPHSQMDFRDSRDAYLGQPRPSDIPQVFAFGIFVKCGQTP